MEQTLKDKIKLYAIVAGVVVLGLFCFKGCRKVQQKKTQVITSTVLKPDEKQAIIVDPSDHKITVVTKEPNGKEDTTTSYFPDQPSRIDISNNGTTKITTQNWDFKLHPTVGAGMSDKPKLFAGVSPIGYKRLDLNIGLETDCSRLSETALNVSLGYNVHNSTYLFLGTNNHKDIEGGVRFRF